MHPDCQSGQGSRRRYFITDLATNLILPHMMTRQKNLNSTKPQERLWWDMDYLSKVHHCNQQTRCRRGNDTPCAHMERIRRLQNAVQDVANQRAQNTASWLSYATNVVNDVVRMSYSNLLKTIFFFFLSQVCMLLLLVVSFFKLFFNKMQQTL